MSDDWHGTPGGWMRHWRAGERPCDACRQEKCRAVKAARVDRDRGNPRMVELGEAAHAIIATIPRNQLSRATGLQVHKLSRMDAAGPDQKVHRRTRDRILATAGQDFWTPIGIQRRLRALQAIGWSARAVAAVMDTEETTLRNLIRRERPQFVRRTYAERVIAVYDQLFTTPRTGPSATRARNAAAEKGWLPPHVWDDIDDPNENPLAPDSGTDIVDQVVVERLLAGVRMPSTRAEKIEAMRRWRATGRSEKSLCDIHGWGQNRYVDRDAEAGAA